MRIWLVKSLPHLVETIESSSVQLLPGTLSLCERYNTHKENTLGLIAPGWYGIANVKWLTRIEVRGARYQGHFMARDYVTKREEERDGETVWTFTSVGRSRLKSAPVKVTRNGDAYTIQSAAWGAPIGGVDAHLDAAAYTWAFWTLDWAARAAGEHTVTSRAIDVDGTVQPVPDDPLLAGKTTYWESNGHITRRVAVG